MTMKIHLSTILILLSATANTWCEEPETKSQKTVTITISPETTYITEPLLPDGRVDYYGAINRRLSEGVTCENNIFAGIFSLIPGEEYALIEALHEGRENDPDLKSWFESNTKFRQKYFQMLGLDAAPDLLSLQKLDPPGSFGAANIDLYQQLLKFYPKDEIDAKLDAQKNEEAENYHNQHKEGKLDDEQLAENLKSLETEKFRKRECSDLIYYEFYNDAMQRIFTEEECPLIADWMKESTYLANKLLEISKRPQSYNPIVLMNDDDTMYVASLPYVQANRETARYFEARGNWHFGRGEYDEALECAFASLRLGTTMRLNTGFVVEELVGIAIQGIAHHQFVDYLGQLENKKDAAWILAKQEEFRAICKQSENFPNPPLWLTGERFGLLSVIAATASHPKYLEEFLGGFDGREEELLLFKKCFDPDYDYDWNKVLKRVNFYIEDQEDIALLPGTLRKARAYERLDDRISEKAELIKSIEITPEIDRERFLADYVYCTFTPGLCPAHYALTRIECLAQMSDVAFSVAAFRSDHGGYPETLEQLVPKYLDQVPVSPYTDKPMRYLKRANDVLLVNDETYKLDGSEEEIEKLIADASSGDSLYPHPQARSFIIILHKE